MRVLITGGRAPSAIELTRHFSRAGHAVFLADSLRSAMGRWTCYAKRYFHLPRPVADPKAYAQALAKIIEQQQVDFLLPTCEEVFFISAYLDLLPCKVFTDHIEKLTKLHDKWTFSQLPGNAFARPPITVQLDDNCTSREQLAERGLSLDGCVLKPIFSRFAAQTIIGPSSKQFDQTLRDKQQRWIAQARVRGVEYSCYSVACEGRLLAFAAYSSRYRVGLGSGIYFESDRHEAIEQYVAEFVQRIGYTGQICFDFIKDAEGQLWVLEANPRATSGVHLFDSGPGLVEALLDTRAETHRPSSYCPVMVDFAMPIWGLADAARSGMLGRFLPDVLRARPAVWSLRDPLPTFGMAPALAEVAWIALRERKSLQQASTFDIEWNGAPL